jgi:hypothetical protein
MPPARALRQAQYRAQRNYVPRISLTSHTEGGEPKEDVMGRGLLLWLLGIPLPIIILIWVLGGLHG